ncbi:SLC17A6 [Branchiostoma lanceolatum]|uniref:SLC17A6 protein n=1 Tax=Branchiostoma lanceolatum TaxID=7740 RepID=A0A8J9Z447_BRALA|nr:SLC17A6 [Branchiostoma lanceolatum]
MPPALLRDSTIRGNWAIFSRFLGKPEEKENLVSKKKKKKKNQDTAQDDSEPRDRNLRNDLLQDEEDGGGRKRQWRCPNTCTCCSGSMRYVISVMASLGFVISFGMRCNLGVSIIKMLENTTKAEEADVNGTSSLVFISVPEFDWQPETVGVVSSAFLWGYLCTQVPGGYLAARYPANRVFGVALFTTCILNLFLPVCARVGWGALAAVRVFQGLAEGMTYPAAHGIWSNWAPPLERTRLSTITFAGTYFGAVTGMPLSGLLADLLGWESPFYFYGAIGLLWSCGWYVLSSPSPARHISISRQEQLYIEESIGNKGENKIMEGGVPWRAMLTSMPVYAIIVANFCRSWTFYLLLTSQPIYMQQSYVNYDTTRIGYLSAIPHFLMGLVVVLGGQLADTLRSRGWSTTVVRKLFNCGGFLSEGIFLLIAAACNGGPGVVAILTVAITVAGLAISGYSVNHLDVAPRYASILMGLSNCIGTVGGMLSPLTVGWLTAAYGYRGWDYVFLIAGLVHINGVIFYFFFGSGEKQPWADPEPEEETDVVIYTRDPEDEDEDEVEFLWDYEPYEFLRLTRRDNFVQLPPTDAYLYGGVDHRDFEY